MDKGQVLPTGRTNFAAIWEARAKALAQATEIETDGDLIELVVVQLGKQTFGVDIRYIQEIQVANRLAWIPGTPTYWLGLVNLRGVLYPVLDLGGYLATFELGDATTLENPGSSQKIILVEAAGIAVGLLVDEVLEVRQVPLSDITPPLAKSTSLHTDLVQGLTQDLVSIIDLEALMSNPNLIIHYDGR
jgi:purine-binding chemotaxis protein CheW